jgi:hypothetical protein
MSPYDSYMGLTAWPLVSYVALLAIGKCDLQNWQYATLRLIGCCLSHYENFGFSKVLVWNLQGAFLRMDVLLPQPILFSSHFPYHCQCYFLLHNLTTFCKNFFNSIAIQIEIVDSHDSNAKRNYAELFISDRSSRVTRSDKNRGTSSILVC